LTRKVPYSVHHAAGHGSRSTSPTSCSMSTSGRFDSKRAGEISRKQSRPRLPRCRC
jgi:hypothetical protein